MLKISTRKVLTYLQDDYYWRDINMTWYEVRKNVIQLLEFLMDCELVVTTDDVIDLAKNPSRYDEVWKIYQREINGVY